MPMSHTRRIAQNRNSLPMTVLQQFGELWQHKTERLRLSSNLSSQPGWNLKSIVVKSFDDLRQESFTVQMAALCEKIWADENGIFDFF